MPKRIHKDLQVLSFPSREHFYEWLGQNYERTEGFWLRYYKKESKKKTVVHIDAVDVALCWGWIDGLINKYDDESYVVRYTPRRPKSVWSKVNVAKVERLIDEGLMQPSGMQHVLAAKKDGRWDSAYAGQAEMELPKEFLKMVNADPTAKAFLATLSKVNRYAIAYRIATAVGVEKKVKVMQKMLERLQQGKAYHKASHQE